MVNALVVKKDFIKDPYTWLYAPRLVFPQSGAPAGLSFYNCFRYLYC